MGYMKLEGLIGTGVIRQELVDELTVRLTLEHILQPVTPLEFVPEGYVHTSKNVTVQRRSGLFGESESKEDVVHTYTRTVLVEEAYVDSARDCANAMAVTAFGGLREGFPPRAVWCGRSWLVVY